jgi:siroheme synthase (precorrin-2 oxidase/ferrochelatase)
MKLLFICPSSSYRKFSPIYKKPHILSSKLKEFTVLVETPFNIFNKLWGTSELETDNNKKKRRRFWSSGLSRCMDFQGDI